MADGQKESADIDRELLARRVAQSRARHAVGIAQHLDGVVFEQHFDVGGVHDSLLHRLGGAQERFAHDHVDLAADRCQIRSLLASRVAAAHHGHVLLAVEEAVARGAGAHAHAAQAGFRLQSEIFGRGSRGDYHALGLDAMLAVHRDAERTVGEVDVGHHAEAHVGSEALRLTFQVVHHRGARYALGVTREILDFGGGRKLPARLYSLVNDGVEVGARSVYGRGVARGAASYYKALGLFHECYVFYIRCEIKLQDMNFLQKTQIICLKRSRRGVGARCAFLPVARHPKPPKAVRFISSARRTRTPL